MLFLILLVFSTFSLNLAHSVSQSSEPTLSITTDYTLLSSEIPNDDGLPRKTTENAPEISTKSKTSANNTNGSGLGGIDEPPQKPATDASEIFTTLRNPVNNMSQVSKAENVDSNSKQPYQEATTNAPETTTVQHTNNKNEGYTKNSAHLSVLLVAIFGWTGFMMLLVFAYKKGLFRNGSYELTATYRKEANVDDDDVRIEMPPTEILTEACPLKSVADLEEKRVIAEGVTPSQETLALNGGSGNSSEAKENSGGSEKHLEKSMEIGVRVDLNEDSGSLKHPKELNEIDEDAINMTSL